MAAAERIFDGSFDHVRDDDGDIAMSPARDVPEPRKSGMIVGSCHTIIAPPPYVPFQTPEADDDDVEDNDDEDEYDSDDGVSHGFQPVVSLTCRSSRGFRRLRLGL